MGKKSLNLVVSERKKGYKERTNQRERQMREKRKENRMLFWAGGS